MGILDSLFGGPSKQKSTSQSVSSPVLSKGATTLFNNAAGIGNAAATSLSKRLGQSTALGDALYNKLSQGSGAFDAGQAALMGQLGSTPTSADIQARMNPYLDSVLASGRQDIMDRAAQGEAARQAAATAARGFGGSRQAVGDRLAAESTEKQLGSLEANARAGAFGQALGQYNAEQQRDQTGAALLGQLQNQEASYGWNNLANRNAPLLQGIQGAQGIAGIGAMTPMGQASSGSGTGSATSGQGIVQQGLGLGAMGYGLGQSFGWFADGGYVDPFDESYLPTDDEIDVSWITPEVAAKRSEDRLYGGQVEQLFPNLVQKESAGRSDATSPKGARGLAQIMPATGREYAGKLGIDNYSDDMLYDSEVNQKIGKAYLEDMLRKYGGDETLALAAYNAGPGRVDSWLQNIGDPRTGKISREEFVSKIPYGETRNYVSSLAPRESRSVPVTSRPLGAPGESRPSAVDEITDRMGQIGPTRDEIYALQRDLEPRKIEKRGLFEEGPAGNPWITIGSALLASKGNLAQALGEAGMSVNRLGMMNRQMDSQSERARQMAVKAQLDNATKLATEDARDRRGALTTGMQIDAQREDLAFRRAQASRDPDAVRSTLAMMRVAGIDPSSPEGKRLIAQRLSGQKAGTSEFERLSSRLSAMDPSDPEYGSVKARVDSLTKGLPEAFEKKEETEAVDRYYKTVLPEGESARASVGRLSQALDMIEQNKDALGKFADTRVLIGGLANELGISPDKVKTAANLEQLNGLLTQSVNEGLRENKGVQTEGDAVRTKEEYGSLKNTPEALQFLVRMKRNSAYGGTRRQEFFDRYMEERGKRSGSDAAWTKYIKDHPMTAKSADDGKLMFYNEFRESLPENTDPRLADQAWEAIAKGRKPSEVLNLLKGMQQ